MTQHVHYDLAAFERQMREDRDKMAMEHRKRVSDGKASASFHDAQSAFDEAGIQFALAAARLANEGHDDSEVAAAAAISVGQSLGSLVARGQPSDVMHAMKWFSQSFSDAVKIIVTGEGPGGNNAAIVTVHEAVPGGRA